MSDFNGDGKADLAVANSASVNVSVLLGTGDGAFQDSFSYDAGTNPSSLVVGDFNRDDKPDLALANLGSGPSNTNGSVSVLSGNGDGTLRAPVNYVLGDRPGLPVNLVAGDFNGDGTPDLVLTVAGSPWSGNRLGGSASSVLLGNGDGTFQPAVTYGTGRDLGSVAVGDLNGDGKPDLAVASYFANDVSLLLGNGDGTFQPAVNYGAGVYPQSVSVADFNGDGKADLAIANSGSGNVTVLLNICVSAGIDLTIARTNSNTVTISWPFPSTAFILESTTNLSLTNWQRTVETPATNNARLEVTVSADPQQRYFRLHKP
ncbi:MAG: VCBS repeat-containing protein [Verrucomicrobia bacterium]|nr:MAG: VCBS repeat-containing protein [Verrucomicrobiota bacterium]